MQDSDKMQSSNTDYNKSDYFTTWSVMISYLIFITSLIIKIPIWLFLFAACILTTTSIMGTFFLTIPSADKYSKSFNISNNEIILRDSMIHTLPLIIFLISFKYLSKRTVGQDDFFKTIFVGIFIILVYLVFMKFENIYDSYDYFCLVVLCTSVFISSYQMYISFIKSNSFLIINMS